MHKMKTPAADVAADIIASGLLQLPAAEVAMRVTVPQADVAYIDLSSGLPGDMDAVIGYLQLRAAQSGFSLFEGATTLTNGSRVMQLSYSPLGEELAEGADDLDDYLPDDDEEEDGEEEDEEDEDDEPASATSRAPGNPLQVLINADTHRLASKLYSCLGDPESGNNMAGYASFLNELDQLLTRFGGLSASPRVSVDEKQEEMASIFAELADAVQPELARGRKGKKKKFKEGRSGLLSALMSAMSGELGEDLQGSWDNMEVDNFRAGMHKAADMSADKLQEFAEEAGLTGKNDGKAKKVAEVEGASVFASGLTTINASLNKEPSVRMAPGKAPKYVPEIGKLVHEDAPETAEPIRVMMPVTGATYAKLQEWAREAGFQFIQTEDELHITVAYSKDALDWSKVPPQDGLSLPPSEGRAVEQLGEQNAVVLRLSQADLDAGVKDRWQRYIDAGGSWDYDDYRAHITISWKEDMSQGQIENIIPYDGSIEFGPEMQSRIKEGGFDVNKAEHVQLGE